jgi:hypothetical protein
MFRVTVVSFAVAGVWESSRFFASLPSHETDAGGAGGNRRPGLLSRRGCTPREGLTPRRHGAKESVVFFASLRLRVRSNVVAAGTRTQPSLVTPSQTSSG